MRSRVRDRRTAFLIAAAILPVRLLVISVVVGQCGCSLDFLPAATQAQSLTLLGAIYLSPIVKYTVQDAAETSIHPQSTAFVASTSPQVVAITHSF